MQRSIHAEISTRSESLLLQSLRRQSKTPGHAEQAMPTLRKDVFPTRRRKLTRVPCAAALLPFVRQRLHRREAHSTQGRGRVSSMRQKFPNSPRYAFTPGGEVLPPRVFQHVLTATRRTALHLRALRRTLLSCASKGGTVLLPRVSRRREAGSACLRALRNRFSAHSLHEPRRTAGVLLA